MPEGDVAGLQVELVPVRRPFLSLKGVIGDSVDGEFLRNRLASRAECVL